MVYRHALMAVYMNDVRAHTMYTFVDDSVIVILKFPSMNETFFRCSMETVVFLVLSDHTIYGIRILHSLRIGIHLPTCELMNESPLLKQN